MIRGYSLKGRTLIVHRLGWNKEIDLTNLSKAYVDHKAMKGSWRLLGNGGWLPISVCFIINSLVRIVSTPPIAINVKFLKLKKGHL